MKNEFELKIKALFFEKIKDVFEDNNLDDWDKLVKIKDHIKNYNLMVAINRELESNEPYVKVVEKLEEAGNE